MRTEASLAWLGALPGARAGTLDRAGAVGLEGLPGEGPCLLTDSRRCQPGDLFVALRGVQADGHDQVPGLLRAGVACVVAREWFLAAPPALRSTPGLLVVEDTRDWLPRAAARVAGLEGEELRVHGVTGTNGKTSTAWILQQLLLLDDPRAGLVGTICSRTGRDEPEPSALTTPDPLWLAAFARRLLDAGGRHLVMEVSSHAIHQRREAVFGFASALFLNLSPEHLDYHADMEEYFRVKASFLRRPEPSLRLVDVDGPWGARLAAELDPLPVQSLGHGPEADWRITDERLLPDGQAYILAGHGERHDLVLPLHGAFQVGNSAAAWLTARAAGLPAAELTRALAAVEPVPGRMEPVVLPGGPRVLIDYAHSPDGYEKALGSLSGLPRRRLHVLFGCGGERDRTKRPVMLEIALRHAERVWVTLDNPRREDPERIFADILDRQGGDPRVTRVDDRAEAIAAMLGEAGPEDLLVLLGKGHERYQLLGTEKRPFDERAVLRAAWERQSGSAS